MALNPHSATAQFFINLKDNGLLNHTGKNQQGWGYTVFGRVIADNEKERLERELRIWAGLVKGGYPEDGDPPGSSTMGPVEARYDDPQTLRLHSEALLAGDACFESLKALVVRWASAIPVVRLRIE